MSKAPTLGKQAKSDLPEALFTESFHESLVHDTARAEANARRRGTSSTLGRGEVSMTTAKAWRQKGTGRARVGRAQRAAPPGRRRRLRPEAARLHLQGQSQGAPQGASRRAVRPRRARLASPSSTASAYTEPSTKQAAEALDKWGGALPVLVVLDAEEGAAAKSFRNIPKVTVLPGRRRGRGRRDRPPLAGRLAGRAAGARGPRRRREARHRAEDGE